MLNLIIIRSNWTWDQVLLLKVDLGPNFAGPISNISTNKPLIHDISLVKHAVLLVQQYQYLTKRNTVPINITFIINSTDILTYWLFTLSI